MRPCDDEEENEQQQKQQTTDHLIFQCKKLRNQRNEMTTNATELVAGNWPAANGTVLSDCLQMFVKFVKSTDFTDLQ